jgi:hypothetical protein
VASRVVPFTWVRQPLTVSKKSSPTYPVCTHGQQNIKIKVDGQPSPQTRASTAPWHRMPTTPNLCSQSTQRPSPISPQSNRPFECSLSDFAANPSTSTTSTAARRAPAYPSTGRSSTPLRLHEPQCPLPCEPYCTPWRDDTARVRRSASPVVLEYCSYSHVLSVRLRLTSQHHPYASYACATRSTGPMQGRRTRFHQRLHRGLVRTAPCPASLHRSGSLSLDLEPGAARSHLLQGRARYCGEQKHEERV